MTITQLLPGITLRCFPDTRFKQGCLSVQLIRPMQRQEAAVNALIPAVLLRGCRSCPDLRAITLRLDDLYGASVSTLVRRVGDYQTTGLFCGFMDDAYAMEGDSILAPMIKFLGELLLQPVTENGGFSVPFVESEKRNLISAMDAIRNDKHAYAAARMREIMCQADSFAVPRLGFREDAAAIEPGKAYAHYQKILRESPIEIFYVGSADPQRVAALLMPIFSSIARDLRPLGPQTPFHACPSQDVTETMEIAQARLGMGFVTPITIRDPRFAAMQMCNAILGGSMTNKLFTVIREKMSLCYEIGSSYNGSKGILSVSVGIESDKEQTVKAEILRQLDACREGRITDDELVGAREMLLSQLRQTHDTPGSIEGYYESAALSGLSMTPDAYMEAVQAVTLPQIVEAAKTLELHTVHFLRGVGA